MSPRWLYICLLAECLLVRTIERNFTTVTLFTEPKTWNEALDVCRSTGDRLLDVTYFSLYIAILDQSQRDPWLDVPVANGPPVWIGLHRYDNILGEEYYSTRCEPLSDFRIARWSDGRPYDDADGHQAGYCVHDEIRETHSGNTILIDHDYTRAECSERHRYFCQHESTDPCFFVHVQHSFGETSLDFSPTNDVIIREITNASCAARCLTEGVVFPVQSLNVLEECWGYTMLGSTCFLHLVVKPTYFDDGPTRMDFPGSQLYIKRCFESHVNNSVLEVTLNDDLIPNTTCGHLDTGTSVRGFERVILFEGVHTWNEGLAMCRREYTELLHLTSEEEHIALGQVVARYNDVIAGDKIWLGLHEPDPVDKPNIMVWANCEPYTSTDGHNITDDGSKLCVVIDLTSGFTRDSCKANFYVICTGDEDGEPSYSHEIDGLPNGGVSLGPLPLSESGCKHECSNTTYQAMECWAYATHRHTNHVCFLYFTHDPTLFESSVIANESYVFRKKMIWSVDVRSKIVAQDESTFPYSCCDVAQLTSICPDNTAPVDEITAPTEDKLVLQLFTVPLTWNEAVVECQAVGGVLLQINSLSKYHAVIHYLDEWTDEGYVTSGPWIGLAQEYLQDPCSLRWNQECIAAQWTSFPDPAYVDIDGKYCVALNPSGMTKAYCNETRGFICEVPDGHCSMEPDDSVCPVPSSVYLIRDNSSCDEDCLATVHNGQECWATVKYDNGSCHLLFYSQPFECESDQEEAHTGSVSRKICFESTLNHSMLSESVDIHPEPYRGCFEATEYPYERDESRCEEMTTLSALSTSTTLSSLSTSTTFNSLSTSTLLIDSPAPSTSATVTTTTFISPSHSVISSTSIVVSSTPSTLSTTENTQSSSTSTSDTTASVSPSPSTVPGSSADTSSTALPVSPSTPTSRNSNETYQPRSIYLSPCTCRRRGATERLTIEEWQSWLNDDLHVPKKNTSRYRRALTCAWDARASSASIGGIAISFLVTFGLYLVIMDVPVVRRGFKYIHGKGRSESKHRYRKKK